MARRLKAPITVQLETTNECNNKCLHCYNYWRYLETGEEVKDDVNRFPEVVDRLIEAEIFHVVLTGGEPLLKFDPLLEGMYRMRKANIFLTMNTNLTLLTPSRMRALKNAGLQGILTSIYSSSEPQHNAQMGNDHGFKDALRGLEIAVGSGLPVGVNMVVNKGNLTQVYATGKMLHNAGIGRFLATRFSPAVPEQRNEVLSKSDTIEMFEQLYRLKREGLEVGTLNPIPYCFAGGAYAELTQERACSAGLTSVGVGISGDVRACQHTDITTGNIFEISLQELWSSMPVWRQDFLPEQCTDCAVAVECGGGCKNFSRVLRGDVKGVDPLYTRTLTKSLSKPVEGRADPNQQYLFESYIKVRPEEDGGVLFKDPHHYAVVDAFTYSLVPSLYKGSFTASGISRMFDISLEKTTNLLWFLEKHGLIYEKMEV